MSRVRYRSIVSVGSQDYVGDGRVSVEGAMKTTLATQMYGLTWNSTVMPSSGAFRCIPLSV